jgi:spermidine/putrescine transport system permease protein
MTRSRHMLGHIYMAAFLVYLFVPLIIMGGAAFNDNRLPSIYPWKGFTWHWFQDLFADRTMWISFLNTIWVALAVVAIAVPLGTAGAILINSVAGRIRGLLYGVMVAPILMPGAVIGISTLLFWNSLGQTTGSDFILFNPGLHLSVLGQVSFIASFVMLLVLARLQSFDPGLEEAAMDLGASNGQVLRRILLPHLYPAIGAGAAIAFFQSIENFNTTLFTRGTQNTLTVYVFSKVRSGITPTINALALLMILATLAAAVIYEIRRRRREQRLAAMERAED